MARNARRTWWFTGSKIARQTVITKQLANDHDGGPGFPVAFQKYPPVGERSATIVSSADGLPEGDLSVRLPWLAFCSGPYLKRPGRQIPLPGPDLRREAFGLKDQTTVFADDLGLPRQIALYTPAQELKCDYEVQQSTNVAGWNLPTAFSVMQFRQNPGGLWEPHLKITARVTSIREAAPPQLPPDVQERLANWEQPPVWRK
jgi:hypothetical protein